MDDQINVRAHGTNVSVAANYFVEMRKDVAISDKELPFGLLACPCAFFRGTCRSNCLPNTAVINTTLENNNLSLLNHCREGSGGHLCSHCNDGYFEHQGVCEKCTHTKDKDEQIGQVSVVAE